MKGEAGKPTWPKNAKAGSTNALGFIYAKAKFPLRPMHYFRARVQTFRQGIAANDKINVNGIQNSKTAEAKPEATASHLIRIGSCGLLAILNFWFPGNIRWCWHWCFECSTQKKVG